MTEKIEYLSFPSQLHSKQFSNRHEIVIQCLTMLTINVWIPESR